jgi:hypothetical protein
MLLNMKAIKKKPIRVYIEPEQDYVLGKLAKKRGISKAEIIRKGLDMFFGGDPFGGRPCNGPGWTWQFR